MGALGEGMGEWQCCRNLLYGHVLPKLSPHNSPNFDFFTYVPTFCISSNSRQSINFNPRIKKLRNEIKRVLLRFANEGHFSPVSLDYLYVDSFCALNFPS